MMIALRLTEADGILFKNYAQMKGISVSEMVRQSVIERIEDECDLKAYEAAYAEYKANPKTYTLDEVEKELGLR